MKSYLTSYNAMFTRRLPDAPIVERVEIPLIQRDYAQGRTGRAVERIRSSFLNILYRAVTGGEPICLDFIFGDVDDGTFHPIDGQQRLTTLFLLHWYLAFRANRLDQEEGWKNFTYATRASARLFCIRLAGCHPPPEVEHLIEWIKDQAWYLYTWRHDPTIQSMLVMLDDMHKCFRMDDCVDAWERLVHSEVPAITFHLLPIEQMGPSEDLYIKMNSRGKPLTPFENFKARFEQVLDASYPDRVKEFALKVDGRWSDLLWPYHGGDYIVDDEFLRYLHFVTEICEWRDGRLAAGDISSLAEGVYGRGNPKAKMNLDFLFEALDTWVEADIPGFFASIFALGASTPDSDDTTKVVLFGQQGGVDINLFAECLKSYGVMSGRSRVFSWGQTIFLYAVLLHRIRKTTGFACRLRVLRNLVEASGNELRLEKMPALLEDVERIVVQGTLDGVAAFNQAQVADERLKVELLAMNPEFERVLYRLEDHPLLRGCLAAFELDAAVFETRANAFLKAFADPSCYQSLTGALLATGDYSRRLNQRLSQFGSGSNDAPWRELLAGAGRAQLATTRDVLGRFLDAITQSGGELRGELDAMQKQWHEGTDPGKGIGWRWYFVRYPAMREGRSGIYVGENGAIGYCVCMLNKSQMNSFYRDAYLLAIHRESGVGPAVEDPWYTGYETQPRWMRLKKSGAEMRCVKDGLVLRAPVVNGQAEVFLRVCREHGVGDNLVLLVPQIEHDGQRLDTRDRVQIGAALLRDLVQAGL